MAKRGRPASSGNNFLSRIFRSFIAIVILTAFVLGISYTVKFITTLDENKLVTISKPLLSLLHISEDRAGEVAGDFIDRLTNTGIEIPQHSGEEIGDGDGNDFSDEDSDLAQSDRRLDYKLAIMSDSEDYFENLTLALEDAKDKNVDGVFFLGDLTSFGDTLKLKEGKKILDDSGLDYYAIPGDHDLAASQPAGPKNFDEVFKVRNTVVRYGTYKFVLFDNSKNFTQISQDEMDWFAREVKDADFVLLSQPLYHPSLNIVMGKIEGQIIQDVYDQAQELLNIIRGYDVKAIIAADQHVFSNNIDPVLTGLNHVVIGALAKQDLRNPPGPRYLILSIYDNGEYEIKSVDL